MRRAILAARDDAAQQRINDAAERIAERLDLPEPVATLQTAAAKDAAVRAMFEREAVADLLEAVAAAVEPAKDEKPKKSTKKDA